MSIFEGLSPALIYGLIPRGLGIVYVVAFSSLIPQTSFLVGKNGLLRLDRVWARLRRDFPHVRAVFETPTLLWLSRDERFIRMLPWLGVGAGLCAIYGGPLGLPGLLAGWVLWLSLEPLGLIFPWDTLLQEAGFLCLFLPATAALPALAATHLPLPAVAFMLRWLLLRLILGFGKDKFIGTRLNDSLYLKGFMVWQTLPSPLGWYLHHAPRWLLRVLLCFMFFAEIIAPVLGLFSGPIRIFAWAVLVSLMLGIHATGNWGHFQLAWILLSLCLLDAHSSIFDLASARFTPSLAHPFELAVNLLMAEMFLLSLIYLPNNTWFSRTWIQWPADMFAWTPRVQRVVNVVHKLFAPVRAIAPYRIVNGYGVFPPHSMPPLRFIPVFEGSRDGVTWESYDLKHMGCLPHSRPRFVAPFHPRFDMSVIYMCIQIHTGSMFGSLLPYGTPYAAYSRSQWLDVFAQKLLQGDPTFTALLSRNPFSDAPPKWVRVAVNALTPTTIAEQRRTGRYWHVRRIVTLAPPRGRENWPESLTLPEPEVFHPDFVSYKRRTPALKAIERAFRSGVPLDQAILEGSDLRGEDVETFWNELVPLLREHRGDWRYIHECAAAVNKRFDIEALDRLERVLERYAWLLRLQLEPQRLAKREPYLPPMSNFRFHMLLQGIVVDGREGLQRMLAQPELAPTRMQGTAPATELWVLTLLRYESMMAHIAGFRLSEMGKQIHNKGLPGIFEYYEFLHKQVPPGEEFAVRALLEPNGEHVVEGIYPADAAESAA